MKQGCDFFVEMPTGVVPVGVAMKAKKGSEVCVCECVLKQTCMWERGRRTVSIW